MEEIYISGLKLKKKPPKGSYLENIPAIKYLMQGEELSFDKPVIFFTGENGSGKSTLVEALAVCMGYNAEGGGRNFRFFTTYADYALADCLTVYKGLRPEDGYFLRAESYFNVATQIEELDVTDSYGDVSPHEQSHGESFLSLVNNRFFGNGLYILDEPEAALSPIRQLTLISRINDLVKQRSQFIISTHSPILLSYPNAEIYQLSESGIEKTEYKETEAYKLYKQFMECPERMLKLILK